VDALRQFSHWQKARGMRSGENPAQWRGHLPQILPARARVKDVRHHPAIPYRELPDFIHRLRKSRSIVAARARKSGSCQQTRITACSEEV